jgi:hypothetical protein
MPPSILGTPRLFNAALCRGGPFPADLEPILDSNYLPSWVPDLRNKAIEQWSPIFGNSFATSNDAVGCLGWSKVLRFSVVLTIHALKLDLVEYIRSFRGNDFKPTTEPKSFLAIVNYIKSVRGQSGAGISYPGGGMADIAWAIALVGRIPHMLVDENPLENILPKP